MSDTTLQPTTPTQPIIESTVVVPIIQPQIKDQSHKPKVLGISNSLKTILSQKKVKCTNQMTNTVNIYDSPMSCAKDLKLTLSSILTCLSNKDGSVWRQGQISYKIEEASSDAEVTKQLVGSLTIIDNTRYFCTKCGKSVLIKRREIHELTTFHQKRSILGGNVLQVQQHIPSQLLTSASSITSTTSATPSSPSSVSLSLPSTPPTPPTVKE